MPNVQIDISDSLLDGIDEIVRDEYFSGRKEAIEALIREGILRRRETGSNEGEPRDNRRRARRIVSEVAEEE